MKILGSGPPSKYFDSGGWVETIWWKYCPLEAVLSPASDGKKSVGALIGVAPTANPAITFKVFRDFFDGGVSSISTAVNSHGRHA